MPLAVDLDAEKLVGDAAGGDEAQRIAADQVILGVGKLFGGRPILGEAGDLLPDQRDDRLGLVAARLGAADDDAGMLQGIEAEADRIGQAALFAHRLVKARVGAAAEDVGGDHGRDEVGVAARDPRRADADDGLRDRQRDVDAAGGLRRHVGDADEIGLHRQVAEDLIEHGGGGLGVDGADDGDLEVVAGEGLLAERLEVVDGDRRDAVGRALRPAGHRDGRGRSPCASPPPQAGWGCARRA